MQEKENYTVYLDQNILSHLREGQPAKVKIANALEILRGRGAIFVYSDVHVEECRAFYDPEQYVNALDEIDAWYIQPVARLGQHCRLTSNRARELILSENEFAYKSIAFLQNLQLPPQNGLGWLGDLEADDLLREMEAEIDEWLGEFTRETYGLIDTSLMRQWLLDSLFSLDLKNVKQEVLGRQPQTDQERNRRFSRIDSLTPESAVDFIFSELDGKLAKHLNDLFPKSIWPNGSYQETGTLASLAFFLFIRDVGRDRKVKSGTQKNRRRRFLAQFRDCRHIEAAAQCDLFLSDDDGAIKIAKAAYAYAGASTVAERLVIPRVFSS